MADLASLGMDDAQTFMISAGLMFEIIAAFCSSPQTAELNADKRAATLMKWVTIGLVVGFMFVLIAATTLHGGPSAIWGGALAGATLGIAYVYAKHSGLRSNQPGTESY